MLTEKQLFQEYIADGASAVEIADLHGLSVGDIQRALVESGIPRRAGSRRPRPIPVAALRDLAGDRTEITRLARELRVSPTWLYRVSQHRLVADTGAPSTSGLRQPGADPDAEAADRDVPSEAETLPRPNRTQDTSADELFELYVLAGLSLSAVGRELGTHGPDVAKRLRSEGIPVRPPGCSSAPLDIKRLLAFGPRVYAGAAAESVIDYYAAVASYVAEHHGELPTPDGIASPLPPTQTSTEQPQSVEERTLVPRPKRRWPWPRKREAQSPVAKLWTAVGPRHPEEPLPPPRSGQEPLPPPQPTRGVPPLSGTRPLSTTQQTATGHPAATEAASNQIGVDECQPLVSKILQERLEIPTPLAEAVALAVAPAGLSGNRRSLTHLVGVFLSAAEGRTDASLRIAHQRLVYLVDSTTKAEPQLSARYQSALESVTEARSDALDDPLATLDDALQDPWGVDPDLPLDGRSRAPFNDDRTTRESDGSRARTTTGGTHAAESRGLRSRPTRTEEGHRSGAQRLTDPSKDDDVNIPSVAGEPPLATPLFRLDGLWAYRWRVGSGGRLTVPIEWLQLNGLTPADEVELALDDLAVVGTRSRYGTTFHLDPVDAIRATSRGRSNDLIFVSVDPRGELSLRRITAQKLGRAATPLRKALLLAGLDDQDMATLQSLLWALGADDPSAGLPEALQICSHRSDGLIARELEAFSLEAEAAPSGDLDSIFSRLDR